MTQQTPKTHNNFSEHLRKFGYLDGDYTGICTDCSEHFTGAKRSMRCKPCAEKAKAEYDAAPPQAPAGNVDVEALKKGDPFFYDTDSDYLKGHRRGQQAGWNDCIDHLHARGLIVNAPMDGKIEGELYLCRRHVGGSENSTRYFHYEPVEIATMPTADEIKVVREALELRQNIDGRRESTKEALAIVNRWKV